MRQLLLTLICFWFTSLPAQTPNFVHYTSTRTVNDIVSDGQYVWAATNGGVVRYDLLTEQITYYHRGNSGIPINEVLSIAIDAQGTRWLGTRVGLVRWQGDDFTLLNPIGVNGTPQRLVILHLRVDALGVVWMHTTGIGSDLKSFDGQAWKVYDDDALFNNLNKLDASPVRPGVWIEGDEAAFYFFDGITAVEHPLPPSLGNPPSFINDWDLDSDGKIWFIIGKQLGVSNGGSWELEELSLWPNAIALSPNGILWVFDEFEGVFIRHPDGVWEQISNQHNFFNGFDLQLVANDQGDLWMGTEKDGLQHLKNGLFSPLTTSGTDIPENAIVELQISGTQTIWAILGEDESLARFQNGQWEWVSETTSNAPAYYCKSMAKDGLDRLWVVSYGQIYLYDEQWKSIPVPAEFPWDHVYSVSAGQTANQVWIGGYGKVGRYNGTDFQIYDAPDPNMAMGDLTVDQQGNIWIPFYTGEGDRVARFDGQNWVMFSTEDLNIDESADFVREITVAPNGDVWVITPNEITTFNGLNWVKLPLEGYTYGGFNTIAFDGNEKVWIGCFGTACFSVDVNMSLIKIEDNNFYFYPYQTTPLPYPNITALAVDAHHNLWIGGEAGGIAVFNENGVTLGINDLPSTNSYSILPATAFPNPTSNTSVVEYTLDTDSDVLLELRSITGQLLQSKRIINQPSGKHQWPLTLNSLAQGTYCWRVLGEKSVANGTIMIKGY